MKSMITGVLAVLLSSNCFADEKALDTQEIDQLLKGNSVSGVHFGKRTAQYFSESGLTLWISTGDQKPAEGQWKVTDEQYCSHWGDENWRCFDIVFDEPQGIYYFLEEGFRAPFVTLEGFSLQL